MKHFIDITRDIIKERNLDYSPELFKSILDEVKTTPKYIKLNKKRNEWLKSISPVNKNNKLGFMATI
jgi:hypothetical protein